MKNAIKTLWNGIKAVFTAIIDWFATLFGMKAETKYARVVRGIVSAAFAVIVIVWAVAAIYGLGRAIHWRVSKLFDTTDDENHYIYGGLRWGDGSDEAEYLTNRSKDEVTLSYRYAS